MYPLLNDMYSLKALISRRQNQWTEVIFDQDTNLLNAAYTTQSAFYSSWDEYSLRTLSSSLGTSAFPSHEEYIHMVLETDIP